MQGCCTISGYQKSNLNDLGFVTFFTPLAKGRATEHVSTIHQTTSMNGRERKFRAFGQPHTQSKPRAHGKGSTRKRGLPPLHHPPGDAPCFPFHHHHPVAFQRKGGLDPTAQGKRGGRRGGAYLHRKLKRKQYVSLCRE